MEEKSRLVIGLHRGQHPTWSYMKLPSKHLSSIVEKAIDLMAFTAKMNSNHRYHRMALRLRTTFSSCNNEYWPFVKRSRANWKLIVAESVRTIKCFAMFLQCFRCRNAWNTESLIKLVNEHIALEQKILVDKSKGWFRFNECRFLVKLLVCSGENQ